MKIPLQILADMISKLTQLDVTCSYDESENMYLLRVFMVPDAQKKSLKRTIYERIDSFAKNNHMDLFYSVQLYTEQETRQYYPERIPPLRQIFKTRLPSCRLFHKWMEKQNEKGSSSLKKLDTSNTIKH